MKFNTFEEALSFVDKKENELSELFKKIDKRALINQKKVLDAFREERVSLTDFAGSTGYGYDDRGKPKLSNIFAKIFECESALVSPNFTCGTHALSCCLLGLLRPGDTMLSVSGAPYDTLNEVINGEDIGSLKDLDIKYEQVDLKDGKLNISKIKESVYHLMPKLVFIQRSRGYVNRDAFTIDEIKTAVDTIRSVDKHCIIMVDNCYGEFIDTIEPTSVGVDIVAGSLIKNIGGGIAPTGGYIAGKAKLVEKIAKHLTAPSLGSEVGSYKNGYTEFYQGLFIAPHVVAGVMKGILLISKVLRELGFKTNPNPNFIPKDIICMVEMGSEEKMIAFCKSLQKTSPVDSFLLPEPSAMPGYKDKVIMAAGTFIQGASIELSCDGPIKSPYTLYIQGGITYEHIKIAICNAITCL